MHVEVKTKVSTERIVSGILVLVQFATVHVGCQQDYLEKEICY